MIHSFPRPTAHLPSVAEAKAQAARLRASLLEDGTVMSHSRALEVIAHQHGCRDWNTLCAAIGRRPATGYACGDRVRGRYLSQPFVATVKAVVEVRPGWFRLDLDLEAAVDVVTFASFSNHRKRVRGTVGPAGYTRERTSDGRPHLVIEP